MHSYCSSADLQRLFRISFVIAEVHDISSIINNFMWLLRFSKIDEHFICDCGTIDLISERLLIILFVITEFLGIFAYLKNLRHIYFSFFKVIDRFLMLIWLRMYKLIFPHSKIMSCKYGACKNYAALHSLMQSYK